MGSSAPGPAHTPDMVATKPGDEAWVFISHKAEDQKVAAEIKRILQAKSDRLECFLFEEQGVGKEFRPQIEQQLVGADWLLLLYTSPAATWDWCLFEAGYFSALMRAEKPDEKHRRLVCLHDGSVEPPHPVENLNTVRASEEEVVKMLVELYGQPIRSGVRPLHEKWVRDVEYRAEVEDCARRICKAIEGTLGQEPISTRRLTNWLTLTLRGSQVQQLKETGRLPDDVEVDGNDEALEVFNFQRGLGQRMSWTKLAHQLEEMEEVAWMSQLACILGAVANERTTPATLPLVFSQTKNARFRTVLQSVDIMPGKSLRFTILLGEVRPEDDPRPVDEPLLTQIMALMDLSKRIQWGVLERYLAVFAEWRVRRARHPGSVDAKEVARELECLPWALIKVENEARHAGIISLDRIRRLFPNQNDLAVFLDLSAKWRSLRSQLDEAIQESKRQNDETKVRDVLLEMQKMSKGVLALISKRQAELFAAL